MSRRRKRDRRYPLTDGAHLLLVAVGAGLGGATVAVLLLGIPLSWAPLVWFLTGLYAYAGLAPLYLIIVSETGGGLAKAYCAFVVIGSLLSSLVGLGDGEAAALGQHWLEPMGTRMLIALAWGAATCICGLVVHHLTIRFVEPC